jgi:hypothetical protein
VRSRLRACLRCFQSVWTLCGGIKTPGGDVVSKATNVNGVPEEGRDTTPEGRASGPPGRNLVAPGSVSWPSPPVPKAVTEATGGGRARWVASARLVERGGAAALTQLTLGVDGDRADQDGGGRAAGRGEGARSPSERWPAAPEAACCGALGCRETENLRRVQDAESGRERVLCPVHVSGWSV